MPPAHSLNGDAPPWTEEVILWSGELHGVQAPWRDNRALQGRFHSPEYPDDIQVVFRQDSADAWERMWVRVIGAHPRSGEYLAKLLNDPYAIEGLQSGENVAFVAPEGSQDLIGVDRGQGYGRAGYPAFSPDAFASSMIKGLNLYRAGELGHVPENIKAAIPELLGASERTDNTTSRTASFYVHFYLGRCYAELYETESAIEQFKKALAFRPEDPSAHIALLAEYSLLAAMPEEELPSGTSDQWRESFNRQESVIRSLFPPSAGPVQYLDLIYTEMKDNLDSEGTIAGKFVLRWKGK